MKLGRRCTITGSHGKEQATTRSGRMCTSIKLHAKASVRQAARTAVVGRLESIILDKQFSGDKLSQRQRAGRKGDSRDKASDDGIGVGAGVRVPESSTGHPSWAVDVEHWDGICVISKRDVTKQRAIKREVSMLNNQTRSAFTHATSRWTGQQNCRQQQQAKATNPEVPTHPASGGGGWGSEPVGWSRLHCSNYGGAGM